MIISDIRTHLLSVPFTDPPKTGFLPLDMIDLLIVEVEQNRVLSAPGISIRLPAACARWKCASTKC